MAVVLSANFTDSSESYNSSSSMDLLVSPNIEDGVCAVAQAIVADAGDVVTSGSADAGSSVVL